MSKNVLLKHWMEDYSKFLVIGALKLIRAQGEKRGGKKVADKFVMNFLKSYVELILTETLQEQPPGIMTERQNYNFTSKNFLHIKIGIQNAISDAFMESLSKFTATRVDYFCDITPVEDPISKLVN